MKTTFVHVDGDLTKMFSEGGDTAKRAFTDRGSDMIEAFICEGGNMTKGILVCGSSDVTAGGYLLMDDGTWVWGCTWFSYYFTYGVG